MSGEMNLTLVTLDRAEKTYQLAIELEYEWEKSKSSSRVNPYAVLVDTEVTLGAVFGLSKLVGKIEAKARPKFDEIIKNTRTKLLFVKEALEQNDTEKKVQSIIDDKIGKIGKREEVSSPKSQKKLPAPEFHFAENNQLSDTFDACYTDQNHKNSASASIASLFVLSALNGIGPEAMGISMKSGHEMHARLMKDRPQAMGHIEIQELLDMKEFEDLKQVNIPTDIDLLQGKDAFHQKLETLRQILITQNLGKLGAILTVRKESYALLFVKDAYSDFILFFDSQGCFDITYDARAYVAGCQTPEAAAEFLAKRMPKIEGAEDNICTITPFCLKK